MCNGGTMRKSGIILLLFVFLSAAVLPVNQALWAGKGKTGLWQRFKHAIQRVYQKAKETTVAGGRAVRKTGAAVNNKVKDGYVAIKQKVTGHKDKTWVKGHYRNSGKDKVWVKGHWRVVADNHPGSSQGPSQGTSQGPGQSGGATPPADEPATPPSDEPATPPADEPGVATGDEPAAPPADEPAAPPADDSGVATGDEPAPPPADEPAAPPADDSGVATGDEPPAPPADEPSQGSSQGPGQGVSQGSSQGPGQGGKHASRLIAAAEEISGEEESFQVLSSDDLADRREKDPLLDAVLIMFEQSDLDYEMVDETISAAKELPRKERGALRILREKMVNVQMRSSSPDRARTLKVIKKIDELTRKK